jgi:hypothetical protein
MPIQLVERISQRTSAEVAPWYHSKLCEFAHFLVRQLEAERVIIPEPQPAPELEPIVEIEEVVR